MAGNMRAVRAYWKRDFKDHRSYKKLSLKQCNVRMRRLPVRPPIWKKLSLLQKQCFLIGAEKGRFGFNNDTGTGKTLLMIALVRYFKKLGTLKRVLILVPKKVHKTDPWVKELRKHSPSSTYLVLSGSSEKKWKRLLEGDETFVIDTYGGFARMLCKQAELTDKQKRTSRRKTRLVPDRKLITRMVNEVDGWISDESIFVKNKTSLAFRLLNQLSKRCPIAFELNATPFGRHPENLWAQAFLLDRGYTLGENLKLFRSVYFDEKDDPFAYKKYVFRKDREKDLHRVLQNVTIRYTADEADLPRLVTLLRECKMPKDALSVYQEAKDAVMRSQGNFQEQKNAFIRARQISSGYVGYYDDEIGVRAQYDFRPNPKMEMLLQDITSVHEQYKFIVFHDFIFTGSMICRELDRMKIGHVRVDGRTKNVGLQLEMFEEDETIRGMILNNKVGAYGLNLQAAKYGLFYERPLPAEDMYQARRRFERQGSLHKTVFLVDYVTKGTFDRKIIKHHNQGMDLFERIVEGKLSK